MKIGILSFLALTYYSSAFTMQGSDYANLEKLVSRIDTMEHLIEDAISREKPKESDGSKKEEGKAHEVNSSDWVATSDIEYSKPLVAEIEMFKNNPTAEDLSKKYSIDDLERAEIFLHAVAVLAEGECMDAADDDISPLDEWVAADNRETEARKRLSLIQGAINILCKKEKKPQAEGIKSIKNIPALFACSYVAPLIKLYSAEREIFKNNPTAEDLAANHGIDMLKNIKQYLYREDLEADLRAYITSDVRRKQVQQRFKTVQDAIAILDKKEESKTLKKLQLITASADDLTVLKRIADKLDQSSALPALLAMREPADFFKPADNGHYQMYLDVSKKYDVNESETQKASLITVTPVDVLATINTIDKLDQYPTNLQVYDFTLNHNIVKPLYDFTYTYAPARPPKDDADFDDILLYGMVKTMETTTNGIHN